MMDYAILFSGMGVTILYLLRVVYVQRRMLRHAADTVVGIALGDLIVRVNKTTKEISITEKEA
jgi:cytochrome c biogenesis protein CcdA